MDRFCSRECAAYAREFAKRAKKNLKIIKPQLSSCNDGAKMLI